MFVNVYLHATLSKFIVLKGVLVYKTQERNIYSLKAIYD